MGTRAADENAGVVTAVAQTDKQREAALEVASKTLKESLTAGSSSLVARDLLSMLQRGASAARVAVELGAFDALHGEQGSGQGLAVAVDAMRLGAEVPDLTCLALLHTAELAMDVSKHRAPRRVPASQDPGREAEAAGAKLAALIEAGDAEAADGFVRGALWRKWGAEVLEPWLFEINTAHFFGDGRGLVATVGALQLLHEAGFDHARRILPGLVFALTRAPRVDESEEWLWFRQRYAQLGPRLSELWQRQGKRVLDEHERAAITRATLDGSRDEAWHAVIGALASGASVESILDSLIRAASERLWRFDVGFAADPCVDVSFLHVSQQLLYTRVLRGVLERHRHPSVLRLVLFAVHAIHQLKRFDQPAERWLALDAKGRPSIADRELLLTELAELIRAREAGEAERVALAYLALGGKIAGLRKALAKLVLGNLYARPESTGHAIQLVCSACELAESLPETDRTWPLRATIRTLASPVREHSLEAVLYRAQRALDASSTDVAR